MVPYQSSTGKKGGVIAYEIGDNYISIQFEGKSIYKYLEASNNKATIDQMKTLALSSKGLTSFIIKNKKSLISVNAFKQRLLNLFK